MAAKSWPIQKRNTVFLGNQDSDAEISLELNEHHNLCTSCTYSLTLTQLNQIAIL